MKEGSPVDTNIYNATRLKQLRDGERNLAYVQNFRSEHGKNYVETSVEQGQIIYQPIGPDLDILIAGGLTGLEKELITDGVLFDIHSDDS